MAMIGGNLMIMQKTTKVQVTQNSGGAWIASTSGSTMVGFGRTKKEALDALEENCRCFVTACKIKDELEKEKKT
jgi:hypothetical protein